MYMRTKYLLITLLGFFLFTNCEKAPIVKDVPEDDPVEEQVITKSLFSGFVQKGPFINGSSVMVYELDNKLNQTGRVYSTNIISNTGAFEHKNIELVSPYVELKADGYYFNEVLGKTSSGQMTLYALTDVKEKNSANVNVLTHLEKARVSYLISQGKDFATAKIQAQREVLAIFGFEPSENLPETMNLVDDAVLLAISSILQGYMTTGDMMELMANISADIRTTGKLNNIDLGSQLVDNAFVISPSEIRKNMETKYTELENEIIVPEFEKYIQMFLDSELYPRTIAISYPETGLYGVNILPYDVESIRVWVDPFEVPSNEILSLRADVPEGMSLKIVLKGGLWHYYTQPNPVINWNCGMYDYNNKSQEFTVTKSGTLSDLALILNDGTKDENGDYFITIEYYENDSEVPTKVKKLIVEWYLKK